MLLLQGITKLPCSSSFLYIQLVFLCLLCPTEIQIGRNLLSQRSWLQLICCIFLQVCIYSLSGVVLAQ